MKSILGVFLFFAALALSSNAQAQSNELTNCNSCSQQQVKAKAKNFYAKTSTRMEVLYVLDYHAPNVWKCDVYVEVAQWVPNIAVCTGAPSQAQTLFLDIVDTLITLQQADVSIEYPSGSIYDIAGCPACAANWIANNSTDLAYQLSGINGLSAKGISLGATIEVPFLSVTSNAEAQLVIRVELANDTSGGPHEAYCLGHFVAGVLTVESDTCVDSDGNEIPTTQPGNAGVTYLFTNDQNYQEMMNTLSRLGYNVETIPSGTVTVNPLTVGCVGSNCEPEDEDDEGEDETDET